MKLVSIGVVIVLMMSIIARGQDTDEAMQAYMDGDYARAIALYEALIAEGMRDSAVYFNLGQAYAQAGELGLALVNYHRAQRLAPRDADIAQRIATLRAMRAEPYSDERGILEQVASLSAFLSADELEWVALINWSIVWGMVMLWRYIPAQRKKARYPFIICGVVVCLILAIAFVRFHVDTTRPLAVVVAPSISVMSGAGSDYFPMFTLAIGAEMRLVERQGAWVKIILPDGRSGWILSKGIVQI